MMVQVVGTEDVTRRSPLCSSYLRHQRLGLSVSDSQLQGLRLLLQVAGNEV